MTANFNWTQRYGSVNSYTETSATILNLVSTKDTANADSSTYPIVAGENSYELWVRPHFTGTFTTIDTIKFGLISGALLSGESVYVSWIQPSGQSYQTPTKTNSTVAVSFVPSNGGTSCYVGISGSTMTQLVSNSLNAISGAFADWIVIQLRTSSNIVAGTTNLKTFQLTYSET